MDLGTTRGLAAASLAAVALAGLLGCEERHPDDARSSDATPAVGPASIPATARVQVDLPTQAARLAFHTIAGDVVASGARHDLRSRGGEVTFTPGNAPPGSRPAAGAPLRLRTMRAGRLDGGASVGREQAVLGGELHIRHQQAVEIWNNGIDGAEQSFRFDERPDGEADLEVVIETSGLDCARSTAAGLHFASTGGGAGVVYGHGTFIDADGVSTHVPAVCGAGQIVLRVPARVVDGAEYPAVLDPVVAPSVELTTPVPGPATGRTPALACSDATCLAVVTDDRDGTLRRYASRFTPGGVLLDGAPVVLGGPIAASVDERNQVALVQDRFLAVFRDGTSARGQLVSVAGEVTTEPFTIGTGLAPLSRPNVACGPDDCLVSWVESGALMANRVDLAGNVLDGDGFVVSSQARTEYGIVHAQGRYLVVYQPDVAGNALHARRVEGAVVLDASPIVVIPPSAAGLAPVSVATDGADFLVVAGGPQNTGLRGTFIGNDGSIQPPGAAFAITAPQSMEAYAFDIVWNGSDYSAIYRPYNSFSTARTFRISTTGVGSPDALDLATGAELFDVAVAPLPSGGAMVAMRRIAGSEWVDARGLDDEGRPVGAAPFRVGHGENIQLGHGVGAGAGQYLVAWVDRRLEATFIVGTRVTEDGTVLDPAGILIAELSDPPAAGGAGLDVSWSGSSFLVAWTADAEFSSRHILAARVGPDGTVLDAEPSAISTLTNRALPPDLAASGVIHMAAWRNDAVSSDVYVARVNTAGDVLDIPPLTLGTGSTALAAWTGQEFLIVSDSRYRTVTAAGVPQQPSMVTLPGNIAPRAMACDASSCAFVVHSSGALRLVPFDAVNETVGPSTIIAVGPQVPSEVIWDGRRFLVVHGADALTAWRAGAPPVPVEAEGARADAPRLASLGGGRSLLTYVRQDETPGAPTRIHASIISSGEANGAPCAGPDGCASGFCADGVCCDVACGDGDVTDCRACSLAAGAELDGVCGLATGTTCRAADGVCDVAELCDGATPECPVDLGAPTGTPCGDVPDGPCALPATCAGGASKLCEVSLQPVGTACRPASGPCDVEEVCDGTSPACPGDDVLAEGSLCAIADPTDPCDAPDVCDGGGTSCAPAMAPDGTPCVTPLGDPGACDAGTCEPSPDAGAGGGGGAQTGGGEGGLGEGGLGEGGDGRGGGGGQGGDGGQAGDGGQGGAPTTATGGAGGGAEPQASSSASGGEGGEGGAGTTGTSTSVTSTTVTSTATGAGGGATAVATTSAAGGVTPAAADEGCSCDVPGRRSSTPGALGSLAVLAALAASRRLTGSRRAR